MDGSNFLCILVLTLSAATSIRAYNVAIFVPEISNSQVIWNFRVAETLQKAGHNVTLIRILITQMPKKELPLAKGIQEWRILGYKSNENETLEDMNEILKNVYMDVSPFTSKFRKMMKMLGGTFLETCELLLQNQELLARLRESHFDVAFADIPTLCSVGLIHYAKIPAWIWMNNAPLIDFIADIVGVHSPSSYVPSIVSGASDEMTFFQRVQSFVVWSVVPAVYRKLVADKQTQMFRKYIDPDFPALDKLAAKCPLVMVNNDEMYALPRPVLHKTVYIGGLGMAQETAKPLSGEFKEIADRASNIIVFSFGSIANASLMPQQWKDAFMESFKKFPEVEFLMRYDIDDLKNRLPPNVHTFKWLPQTDILHLPKTRALITHGGAQSFQEAINAATPLIPVPLFGDQIMNAKLAEKRGFGIILHKSDINEATITDAVKRILTDESYAKSVTRMRNMIRRKPVKPEELLVRWTEFVAEFKDLENLTPQGVELDFIKYYSIDVFVFLLGSLLVIIFVWYKVTCRILSYIRRKIFGQKKKKE